jgi:hypothetical protein
MEATMPKRFRTKTVAIAAGITLTVAGSGIAFAYWTSTGSGTGSATTGTSAAFTIVAGTPAGVISPGGAGQTVGFTVTNPGPGIQSLAAVSVAIATGPGAPWVPPTGCLLADYTAAVTTAPTPGPIAVGGNKSGIATVTLANTGVNQDACQGTTVPLYFTAS